MPKKWLYEPFLAVFCFFWKIYCTFSFWYWSGIHENMIWMFLLIFWGALDTPDPKIAQNHEKWPKMAVLAIFDDFFWATRTKIHKLFFLDIELTWREEYFENIFFQNFEVLGVQGTQNGPLLSKNFFWKFFLEKKYLDMKVGFNICWLIPISIQYHQNCPSYD